MKIYRLLILVLGLSVWLSGCKDEAVVQIDVAQEYQNLEFAARKEQKTIQINADGEWYISSSDTSWCTTSHVIGEGEQYVNVYVTRNNSGSERTAVLTVSAKGSKDILINVVQEGNSLPVYDEYIEPDETEMGSMTALELSVQMGAGVNIGNTFEAGWLDDAGYAQGDETAWGNLQPRKALFEAIKAAGFTTVRIPVRLDHSLQKEGIPDATWACDDYVVKDEWMDKIETSVSEALETGLYVIIDMHEGYWMEELTYEVEDYLYTRIEGYWKQLALRFRDYDYHLLFAGVNEIAHSYDDGRSPSDENFEVYHNILQTFVNTVRATGGRNYYRYLVAPAYVTSGDYAVDNYLSPADVVADRLFCEVHTYNPYPFTLQPSDEEGNWFLWGRPFFDGSISYQGVTYDNALYEDRSWGMEDALDESFYKLKINLIDEGMPVIVGEYIGGQKREYLKDTSVDLYNKNFASRLYFTWYQTNSMHQNGLVPVYWDTGGDITDRKAETIRYEDGLVDAIMAAMNGEEWDVNLK